MKNYITLQENTLDEVWDLLKTSDRHLIIQNHYVKVRSQRYKLFKKSNVCAFCGVSGSVMKLQKDYTDMDSKSAHFNLYTEDGILMTKDHILPKALGGKDVMSNYQTMCLVCNLDKGCKI